MNQDDGPRERLKAWVSRILIEACGATPRQPSIADYLVTRLTHPIGQEDRRALDDIIWIRAEHLRGLYDDTED